MRIKRRILVLLSAAAFLSGCVGAMFPEEWVYYDQGRSAEQVRHMEAKLAPIDEPTSSDLFFLCNAYVNVRDFSHIFSCADRLQETMDRTQFYSMLGLDFRPFPYLFRAEGYLATGQYQKAADEAKQAYRVGRDVDVMRAYIIEILPTYGVASALAGRKQEAQQAIADLEATGTFYPYNGLTPAKQAGLARMYMATGQYQKAAETDVSLDAFGVFAEALGSAVAGFEMDQRNTVYETFLKAKAVFLVGDYEQARQHYAKLKGFKQLPSYGDIHWQVLHDDGVMALEAGDRSTAISQFAAAIDLIEAQRSTLSTEATKIGYVGSKQSVYADIVAALVDANRAAEAFEYAERGKARALVDLLASKKSFGGQSPIDVEAALSELDRLEKQSYRVASVEQTPETTVRGIQVIRENLSQSMPEVSSLVSVSAQKITDIQTQLRADEALLEYFYEPSAVGDDGRLYAFLVTRSDARALKLSAQGLNRDVEAFRAAINTGAGDGWRASAGQLHQRLLTPLAVHLQGRRHLTVVPHGVLHYLPFNALLDRDGKLVIERHTLRLLPSASVMRFLNKGNAPTQSLLAFGNPDLNDPTMDLPGAQDEAQAIAQIWPDSRVVVRGQATEGLVKKTAGAFKFLHIASHGQFDPAAPLQSRLLFAADATDDGNLTVPEIYDLRLNADMVVLSACQTALGDVRNGDDVVGLNRGFLYAGAKSVVGSLWEVADEPTRDLMVALYRNLKTQDQRLALRQAQITTLRKYPHPSAWAAFQLVGGL